MCATVYGGRVVPSGESYGGNLQAWQKVVAAYHRVYGLKSPVGWLPVPWNQLQAKHSVTSIGEL